MTRYCWALTVLPILGGVTTAQADNTLTGIIVTSPVPDDICIGEYVSYKITWTGSDPVQNVLWQNTCTDCTPQNTVNLQSGPYTQISKHETKLGSFTIKAVVTFQRYPMGGTYQQSKTVDIVVNPPDHVLLANGSAVLAAR